MIFPLHSKNQTPDKEWRVHDIVEAESKLWLHSKNQTPDKEWRVHNIVEAKSKLWLLLAVFRLLSISSLPLTSRWVVFPITAF